MSIRASSQSGESEIEPRRQDGVAAGYTGPTWPSSRVSKQTTVWCTWSTVRHLRSGSVCSVANKAWTLAPKVMMIAVNYSRDLESGVLVRCVGRCAARPSLVERRCEIL